MILPALILSLGYGVYFLNGYYFGWGRFTEAVRAQKALDDALAKAPSAEMLAGVLAKQKAAAGEVQAIERRLESLRNEWKSVTNYSRASAERNERIKALNALMIRHGVSFIEENDVDAGKDGNISVTLDQLAQRISQGEGSQRPTVRRIRFHATYHDLQDALYELSQGNVLAIPLGLTMKRLDDSQRREWTLLVWI